MRPVLLLLVLPLVLLAILGVWWTLKPGDEPTWHEVALSRGAVAREAVAVGSIQPIFEIPVTATVGGTVTQVFVTEGQKVEIGAPLCEVRPVLTEAQKLAAERALLGAREAEVAAAEIQGGRNVLGWGMRLIQGGRSVDRMRAGAARARSSAEEQLALLLEGSVEVDGRTIDWIVRAQASGHVLQLDAEVGQPVVPASNFGAGTILCVLGDLDRPVFRGTVDELDAGALRAGLKATVTLGAHPSRPLGATLSEISLRGQRADNVVSFPVEATVEVPGDLTLRAGYSAVARIELERVEDVLLVPERLVTFAGERAFVLVPNADGAPVERDVELGLGDGFSVQVTGGLREGDVVLERGSR